MYLKIHFLHSHLNFFLPNLGEVSDEQGERFYQDISVLEGRHQSRFDANMMEISAGIYSVRARARHTIKKPNV